MVKLTGAKKAAFLKRMALGRKKAKSSTKKGQVRKTARRAFTGKRKSVTTKRKWVEELVQV